jgi:transposase
MDEIRERAREALARLGKRGRTTRIPDDVRAVVLGYVERERSRGRSRQEVADELGLSSSVLVRWAKGGRRRRGKIVPIRLLATPSVSPEAATIRIVSPSGYRIEGLSVRDAVEVIRAIG